MLLSVRVLLVSSCRCLDILLYYNFQDLKAEDFEQQLGERGKGSWTYWAYVLYLYFTTIHMH
jgi:hypothetical protein